MIHASTSNRPIRMNMAMPSPSRRRQFALLFRQLVDQDGNENDVVDAQHQFQRRSVATSDPGVGVGQEFKQRARFGGYVDSLHYTQARVARTRAAKTAAGSRQGGAAVLLAG